MELALNISVRVQQLKIKYSNSLRNGRQIFLRSFGDKKRRWQRIQTYIYIYIPSRSLRLREVCLILLSFGVQTHTNSHLPIATQPVSAALTQHKQCRAWPSSLRFAKTARYRFFTSRQRRWWGGGRRAVVIPMNRSFTCLFLLLWVNHALSVLHSHVYTMTTGFSILSYFLLVVLIIRRRSPLPWQHRQFWGLDLATFLTVMGVAIFHIRTISVLSF